LRRTIGGGVENAANRESQIAKRDIRLTKIAITIVCVFVTCHVPRFVPNVIEIFTEKEENLPAVSQEKTLHLKILHCDKQISKFV
jgi:hypothetical protein